ncbi:MAG: LysR family transcriptional regulator [Rhodocyclaceae bacterium]|nr:LysR family transcriptional regulator [Rhodocyclaceae bacterium]
MLHLTLRQLKVFEAVARHASFSRAAEELHLSQPAVSMQVKQLEENVGMPLLEQQGKRTVLTEAGREIYDLSRRVANQIDQTEENLAQLRGDTGGRLRLAVVGTANYFVPQMVTAFRQANPDVTVSLTVNNRASVVNTLTFNERDLAIMGDMPTSADLEGTPFMENHLVVIAPPHHGLAGRGRVPMERLKQEVFLIREPGSSSRAAMEDIFANHGMSFATGMEMSSNESIKQAVQAGLGLGILSLHTVALELETGRLAVLPVEGFPVVRQWHIAHRTGKRLPAVAEKFRQFVLQQAAELVPLPRARDMLGSLAD